MSLCAVSSWLRKPLFQFSEVIQVKSKIRSVQLGRWVLNKQEREIERAIQNAKRTEFDKRFRRQWYRGMAISKWSPERKARYVEWRKAQIQERDGPIPCMLHLSGLPSGSAK